jgi:hypothetical protein
MSPSWGIEPVVSSDVPDAEVSTFIVAIPVVGDEVVVDPLESVPGPEVIVVESEPELDSPPDALPELASGTDRHEQGASNSASVHGRFHPTTCTIHQRTL